MCGIGGEERGKGRRIGGEGEGEGEGGGKGWGRRIGGEGRGKGYGGRRGRDDVCSTITINSNCVVAVLVFGFYHTTFAGVERGQVHTVEVGFLSGLVPSRVGFDIELAHGTARKLL